MIQFTAITLNADNSWTFAWADAGASFYRVVLWGRLLVKQTERTYRWNGSEYQNFPPPLEVGYENQPVLSEQFVPYLLIQWYGESTDHYEIRQYDGASWNVIAVTQETGQWIYSFQTSTLTDETTYQYEVVAVDQYDNEAQPRQYRRYVVCPPKPPDGRLSVSYAAGAVTVASV